jgi:uncharacterized protein YndB with AHSA1/START domain
LPRITESVEIKQSVEKVFSYVTNMDNLPKWVPEMVEVEQTSSGPMGLGTTLKGVYKVMGARMTWTSKVTEYELNKKWGEYISSGSMTSTELLTFEPTVVGTKFAMIYDMKVGGLLKILSPLMTSTMRKQNKVNFAKLKDILENQK